MAATSQIPAGAGALALHEQGLTYTQIAGVLGVSKGVVAGLVYRARGPAKKRGPYRAQVATRRKEMKAATRARLLAAAKSAFELGGYEAATMRSIAADAGMSTGAIFANWPGKAEIYAEAFGHPPVSPEAGKELLDCLNALVLALSNEAGALSGPEHMALRRRVFAAIRATQPQQPAQAVAA